MPPGTERQDRANDGQESARGGDLSSFDQAITDLQGRISDLRVSVDEIGRPHAEAPPQAPPSYAPPEPPPSYEAPPAAYEPPPVYEQPPTYDPPPAAYEPPPPAYSDLPPEPPPEVFLDSPSPAGAVPAEGSDVLDSFSRVDVGPFEDLLAMTAFEAQLSALPSMAEVRVRRFGAGRAEIELATAGVVPVARELMRVAPDARPVMQPDGSLIVELTDPRWTGAGRVEAEEEQQVSEPTEGEPGDPHG